MRFQRDGSLAGRAPTQMSLRYSYFLGKKQRHLLWNPRTFALQVKSQVACWWFSHRWGETGRRGAAWFGWPTLKATREVRL